MGIGFRLNFRCVPSVKYPYKSSSLPSSYSYRGTEVSYDTARVSFPYVVLGETEIMYNDPLRVHSSCSSAAQLLSDDYSETEHVKINVEKSSCGGMYSIIKGNFHTPAKMDQFTPAASLQASKASHFGVLMNNLNMLETTFADSDVIRLESDILSQLDRLGALKLFHTCLSRTRSPPVVNSSVSEFNEEHQMNNHMAKIVVCSGKKEERKAKRMKASEKEKHVYLMASPSQTNHIDHQHQNLSYPRRTSKYSASKPKITRNEAELTIGVKLVANLEKIRMLLEKETGETASLSSWAEAAKVDKKTLQQNLHFGSYCKDELRRSTRSLIVYVARNYRGLGVGFEDLIQAGNVGVLQGAERFEHTRGYKFSTYIQYWIRKSILMLVERNSRGVRIPFASSKTVKKIQKARRTLCNSLGKYPDDYEIAKYTGLSLSKITSASNFLRVVGSLNQKIGDFTSVKFLEIMPDTSIKGPEETVMRQHLIKDMYELLDELDPRERQVLVLRLGLQDNHCKSLQEIGRLFSVSKEWIRKIERRALTKLRDQETLHSLSHYLYIYINQ